MAHQRRSGASRGLKQWSGTVFGTATITATPSNVAEMITEEPCTVLRIRGNIFCFAIPDAASDDDVLGLGIIVQSIAQKDVGGASLDGPITDPSSPWLWHQYVPLSANPATAGVADSIGLNVHVAVDTKAMRKVGISETVVLVAQLQTGQMSTVQVNGGMRTLCLVG